MTENPFKNELLKQNGQGAVDREVSRLHAIIDSERRRVRRLMWWTIGVWTVWFATIAVGLLIYFVRAQANPQSRISNPANTQPAVVHQDAGSGSVAPALVALFFASVFALPVIGVILAIMLMVSHRTAGTNQIRAGLAAIDAQLRMLGGTGVKSDKFE
jgi:hypothetical protein